MLKGSGHWLGWLPFFPWVEHFVATIDLEQRYLPRLMSLVKAEATFLFQGQPEELAALPFPWASPSLPGPALGGTLLGLTSLLPGLAKAPLFHSPSWFTG